MIHLRDPLQQELEQFNTQQILIFGPTALKKSLRGEALFPVEETSLVPFACFLEIAVMMAAVDGEIAEQEVVQIFQSFNDLSGGILDDHDSELIFERTIAKLSALGFEACAAENAAQLQTFELRKAAYHLAIRIAYADNEIRPEEVEAIQTLAHVYGITEEEAQIMLDQIAEAIDNESSTW